jgi:purine-binding chemotaxis protein CheW
MATLATAKRAAAIEVVVFRVEDVVCGMDILDVQEIKKIHAHTPVHRAPAYVRGLVNMRGHVVTLIDVGHRLGLGARPVRRAGPAIILSVGDELVGLLVDEVDDVIVAEPGDVVAAPSNLGGAQGRYFEAVVRTHDGLVALIDKERIAGADSDERAPAIREARR